MVYLVLYVLFVCVSCKSDFSTGIYSHKYSNMCQTSNKHSFAYYYLLVSRFVYNMLSYSFPLPYHLEDHHPSQHQYCELVFLFCIACIIGGKDQYCVKKRERMYTYTLHKSCGHYYFLFSN
jgi:hypothetical protein